MQALLFLSLCQIKNAFRSSLRNPAIWIPLLCVVLLISFRGRSPVFSQTPLPGEMGGYLVQHLDLVHAGVFLIFVLLALGYIDTGLSGNALKFALPDVALLFPAPFPRRLVLLFKLPSALSQHLLMVAFLGWVFRVFIWLPLEQQRSTHGGGWSSLGAALLCIAGFLNLASTLDLYSALGRIAWVGRAFRLLSVLGIAALSRFLWTHGTTGLAAIDHSMLASAVFSPCHVTADIILSPFQPVQLSGAFWVFLFGWYGLTLTLLLTRRVNFYEAGALSAERVERIRQALRSGNWAAAGRQPGASRLSASLPSFGQGGAALFWAHLSAAAKRPGLNFALPFFGGLAVAALVGIVATRSGGGPADYSAMTLATVKFGLGIATGYYILYAVALVGVAFYQRALAREMLIRPLPLPTLQVVGAEIASRSLLGSLFPWGMALALLALRLPGMGAQTLTYLVAVPALIVCLNVLSYRLALVYPNASNKVQAWAAGFVQLLSYTLLSLAISPFLAVPAALHAPDWVSIVSVTLGLWLSAGLLFRSAVRATVAFESSEDSPPVTLRQWTRAFRKGMSSPPLKKAAKPLIVIAVIVLAVAVIGSRVNKALHHPPPPPRTVQTRLGNMAVKVSETGTIQPVDQVNVESKAPGRLLSIPITEGQRVKKGQLIAIVDRSQLDPQIAGLRAQLSQAQARFQQTIAQYNLQVKQSHMAVSQAEANLHSAETHLAVVAAAARPQELAEQQEAVERAQISLDDAQRTQKRRQDLLTKGYISQSDADSSQVAVDTAASNLASAQQALALTQAGPRPQDVTDARAQVQAQRVTLATAQANLGQVAVSRGDIAQARAAVQQIQNQLAQLLVQLADTRIVAPAAGIVLKKYKETDEIVQSATTGFSDAQSLIATLGSRLEVQVGINEVDIPKVRVDAPVDIHVDALPNTTFTGHVTEVAPASTNAFSSTDSSSASGVSSISKFNVKVALSTYDARLRPGMTANVDIISARHNHVVLAPLEAIPGTGNTAVVTVLVGKTQQKRTVGLGLRDDTEVEITHGLRPGENLVVPPINGAGRRKFQVG